MHLQNIYPFFLTNDIHEGLLKYLSISRLYGGIERISDQPFFQMLLANLKSFQFLHYLLMGGVYSIFKVKFFRGWGVSLTDVQSGWSAFHLDFASFSTQDTLECLILQVILYAFLLFVKRILAMQWFSLSKENEHMLS